MSAIFRLVLLSISRRGGAHGSLRGFSQGSRKRKPRAALDRRVSGRRSSGAGAFYLFLLRRDADLETLLPDISEAQRGLDVVLLHRLILEKCLGITAEAVAAEQNVSYERETDAAIAAVDRGEAQLALLLNPASVIRWRRSRWAET